MSWRDHEYDHGTYLPRGCRRAEDAADLLRKYLTTVERERDAAQLEALAWKGEADLLAKVLRRNPLGEREIALECFDAFSAANERRKARRAA